MLLYALYIMGTTMKENSVIQNKDNTRELNEFSHDKYDEVWEQGIWSDYRYESPYNLHRIRLLAKLVKKYDSSGNASIVDAGAGNGMLLERIYNSHRELYAYDFSESALKLISNKMGNKVECKMVDLTDDSTIPPQKFDMVISAITLEHIVDDCKAIQNLSRLLLSDGVLIVQVPYSMHLWTKWDNLRGHVRRYEKGELKRKLSYSGLKVVENFLWGIPFTVFHDSLFRNLQEHRRLYMLYSKLYYIPSFIDELFKNNIFGVLQFTVAKFK